MISPIISIKKISLPDFGLKESSKQTHIGLFSETYEEINLEQNDLLLKLEYSNTGNKNYFLSTNLIFENNSFETISILKYINDKKTGNFRSPAIRKGRKNELLFNNIQFESTSIKIIDLSKESYKDTNYFLICFYLDTNELIFLLIKEGSNDFNIVSNIISIPNLNLDSDWNTHIRNTSSNYSELSNFLISKYNNTNNSYLQELEIATQTGTKKTTKRIIPRPQDIERANKVFKAIGEKGERLLFQYLESEKRQSNIKDFKWINQSREMYQEYDFEIINNDGVKVFSDAKATNKNFDERPIYLSTNELSFINDNKENYQIHRLYSINDKPKLRICNNIYKVSDIFIPNYINFNNTLNSINLAIKGVNLAVPTNLDIIDFENEILLNTNI